MGRAVLIVLAVFLGIDLGVAAVVFGGYDDSPGLQGIGVLIVLGSLALGVRAAVGAGRGSSR